MQISPRNQDVSTITLNPAIDRTVTIRGFTAGAVNRVEEVTARPGGKGINVAGALADFGRDVAALGFLGRDNDATFTSFFASKRIEDRCLRLPGHTRVGIKISDPVLQQTTDINFPGLAPSATELAALRGQLADLSARWHVLAGSVPPGVAPEIYREFISILKARGGRVVLDTSGEPLRQALVAKPDIIKPNIHELETLVGETLPTTEAVIDAAQSLVAGGIPLVVISRGEEGACFVTSDEVVLARPPSVEVRSTVGAGDAMVAGLVAGQLLELPLASSARLATAFSLAALTRQPGENHVRPIIEAFMDRVQVESVLSAVR